MKFGIIVSNLLSSQLVYSAIRNVNSFLQQNLLDDCTFFYEHLSHPCAFPLCPMMHVSHAWAFDGILISTNLSTTAKLLDMPAAKRKFFYVHDLEWTRGHGDFEELASLYRAEGISLIARSADHAQMISSSWNRDVEGIMESLDLQYIKELAQNDKLSLSVLR